MKTTAQTISIDKSQMLKGLAILAVVIIHIFSNLRGIYTVSEYRFFYIAADQILRFCVPIFLLLSGYGLAAKYAGEKLALVAYVKRRVLKLIPLYLLWSLFSYALFVVVPGWDYSSVQEPLWSKLLYGRADYHLYFLPLIFQLYLFFPIILWFTKRLPRLTVFTAFCVQVAMYSYYAAAVVLPDAPKWALSDSLQYLFFASWIGYFVLGVYLAIEGLPVQLKKVMPLLALLGMSWVINSAYSSIKNFIDPLIALKFTKYSVIGYTVPTMIAMMMFSLPEFKGDNIIPKSKQVIKWLGDQSYIIFLSHTIALRMYNTALYQQLPLSTIFFTFVVWLAVVMVSKKLS